MREIREDEVFQRDFAKVFFGIDRNHDRKVTDDEFYAHSKEYFPGSDEYTDFMFDLHDQNSDGAVMYWEAKEVASTEHLYDVIEMTQKLWQQVDEDDDVALDFDEFVKVYEVLRALKMSPEATMDDLQGLYDKFIEELEDERDDVYETLPSHFLWDRVRKAVYDMFDQIEI